MHHDTSALREMGTFLILKNVPTRDCTLWEMRNVPISRDVDYRQPTLNDNLNVRVG